MGALLKHGLRHRGYLRALSSSYLLMAVSILVQIALVPLYLAALGRYKFGVLMVLLNLVNFAVFGIAWISGGSLRLLGECAARQDDEAFRRAFGLIKLIYVGYAVGMTLLLVLAAWLFDARIFSGGSSEDILDSRNALMLTGVYLIFSYATSVDRLALIALKRQAQANLSQLVSTIVFAACVVPWLYGGVGGGSLPGVMLCQIVGALTAVLISPLLLRAHMPDLRMRWPARQDAGVMRQLGGRTGAGFFIHGALVLAMQFDTALIGWFGGAKAAAEFYLVWKVAEVAVQLIGKIPESMAPYFVQMDVREEHASIDHIARRGYLLVGALSLVAGIFYAMLGQQLVALWVGADHVPDTPLGFALAGGAIFWLGISRLPAVVASARVTLRALNTVGAIELLGKMLITLLLFPRLGYVALFAGLNLTHILGVSFLYFRLLRREP